MHSSQNPLFKRLSRFSKSVKAGSRSESGTATFEAQTSMMKRYANQCGFSVMVDTVGCDEWMRRKFKIQKSKIKIQNGRADVGAHFAIVMDERSWRFVDMKVRPIAALILACGLLAGCDAMTSSSTTGGSSTCTITAIVSPATATADHTVAAPGNQVTFTASSTVTGNCPLTPDTLGSWSTSDPTNTTVTANSQSPTQAVATCRNVTPAPATISYSGTVRGRAFANASLACK